MRPIKQISAIAKACGWTHISNANTMAIDGIWVGYPPKGQIIGQKNPLPNYLEDLNAMHEAEKVIRKNVDLRILYRKKLSEVCYQEWPNNHDPEFATAAQRAEAFLRTLKLWKE